MEKAERMMEVVASKGGGGRENGEVRTSRRGAMRSRKGDGDRRQGGKSWAS